MHLPKFALTRPQPAVEAPRDALGAVAHLATLHREAEETARLANLLARGRSLHACHRPARPRRGRLGLQPRRDRRKHDLGRAGACGVGGDLPPATAAPSASLSSARRLKSFSQDLRAILVFAGFAWGAGAFLVLPARRGRHCRRSLYRRCEAWASRFSCVGARRCIFSFLRRANRANRLCVLSCTPWTPVRGVASFSYFLIRLRCAASRGHGRRRGSAGTTAGWRHRSRKPPLGLKSFVPRRLQAYDRRVTYGPADHSAREP